MTGFNRVFSRVPGLVVLFALMTGVTGRPALAQDNHIQRYGEEDKEQTATQKAAEKEAERAYQRSLGNIPAQNGTDPWGIARGEDTQPKTAKAAPAKPKTRNDAAKNTAVKPDATKSADSKTGGAAK